MQILFASTTPLTGSAPWKVGEFELSQFKAVSITAYGLTAGDSVCIEQVVKVQPGSSTHTVNGCSTGLPDAEVVARSQQLVDCGVKVCICDKQPWVRIDSSRFPPGDYRLSVSGASFSNGTALITSELSDSSPSSGCDYCAACEPAVVPPAPVTQTFTPCPVVFPALWNGNVYANASLLQAGIVAQGWSYSIPTCTVTAPAGTVLPAPPVAAPTSNLIAPSFPIVFPVLYNGVSIPNMPALDAAIETEYGVSVSIACTSSGCTVTQTSGGAGSLPATITVTAPPPANTGVLSQCPAVFPVLFQGSSYANLIALKQAVEAIYSVSTTYDTATCTFTKVGGAGSLPATIAIEGGCTIAFAGGTVNNNAGTPQFRIVTSPVWPVAGFVEMGNNTGALVSLLRVSSGTQCGITFNVPVNNNAGTLIGFGAQL